MSKMTELSVFDIDNVTGGNGVPGQSIYEQLMEKFPFGEWIGNSFFPNGIPDGWPY